ncbi:MAG TPA: YihY/virulence factor BrkB family protein [Pyrinomonadaceae bacterium]|nr:YihY/virulence factor BrkB family protein [Pyrinomonadaceae bacterium]
MPYNSGGWFAEIRRIPLHDHPLIPARALSATALPDCCLGLLRRPWHGVAPQSADLSERNCAVSAFDLFKTTVDEISQKRSGGKLWFGLLTSLWFASSGMGAIIEGLNVAFDVKETRAWWRRTLLAILLTIALAVLIITALALMFYGSRLAEALANHYGFGAAFTTAWKVLRWVFVVVFVFLAFELIYYFAPDLNIKQLRWFAPGAMTGGRALVARLISVRLIPQLL